LTGTNTSGFVTSQSIGALRTDEQGAREGKDQQAGCLGLKDNVIGLMVDDEYYDY